MSMAMMYCCEGAITMFFGVDDGNDRRKESVAVPKREKKHKWKDRR
jgi:hypothetical protein